MYYVARQVNVPFPRKVGVSVIEDCRSALVVVVVMGMICTVRLFIGFGDIGSLDSLVLAF